MSDTAQNSPVATSVATETPTQILTDEQEKEIGILQQIAPLIVQQILAIMTMLALIYMVAIRYEAVPPEFLTLATAIIVYYFPKK